MQNFEEIYKKYYGHVFETAKKYTVNTYDAEDILQETFMALYCDMQKRGPEGYRNIKCWLSTVAKNKALNKQRKEGRTILQEDISLLMDCKGEIVDNSEDDYIKKMTGEERGKLCKHILNEVKKVSKAQYETVIDSCYYNMASKEIARKNNTSTACIDAKIYRTRKAVRERFSDAYSKLKYA